MKFIFLLLLSIILISNSSCRSGNEKKPSNTVPEAKKRLETINRVLVDKDKEVIQAYIKRHRLETMEENESGLYYLVWGEPKGPKVESGDVVVLNYKVSLIDGTVCYSSENGKPKEFLVGQGGVESGLEMGVLLMAEGQKGKFILPPHLAHGLLGDSDKIPPLAIIIYDVELVLVIES